MVATEHPEVGRGVSEAGYRFHHDWTVPAPRQQVYDVLADVTDYPTWWRQVIAVALIDDRSGFADCRSLAPFTLRLRLTSEREDPDEGILRVGIDGDLEGWCEFRLTERGAGTEVAFEQSVVVRRPLLRRASRVLGPALRVNHSWMMRGCRRGLERRLAG
jgi:uncharacterized membrane protein